MLHIKPKLMAALMACVMILLAMGGTALGEDASAGDAVTIPLHVNGYELIFRGPLTEGTIWKEIPETEDADFRFCMPVRGEVDVPLFTMTLWQSAGDYAMVLKDASGNEVPVSFSLAPRPEGLTDEEKWAFSWAQADIFVLMETLQLTAVPDAEAAAAQGDPFRIITDAFELTYDARWRGRLAVEPGEDDSLVFNAVIDKRLYPVFVLRYGCDDGHYVILLRSKSGRSAEVSFDMLTAPAELGGQARERFYEVQEIIEEITKTMTLR